MKIGTSYFVSKTCANRYYQRHGGFSPQAVTRKIQRGEIHIGKPTLKPGERLELIDNNCRYAIIDEVQDFIKRKPNAFDPV